LDQSTVEQVPPEALTRSSAALVRRRISSTIPLRTEGAKLAMSRLSRSSISRLNIRTKQANVVLLEEWLAVAMEEARP
jgi:hypothetical protein